MSETALAAWRSARRMPRDATEARMWLFGVARNTLLHRVRSTVRRDALHSRLTDAIRASPATAETEAAVEVRAAVDAPPTSPRYPRGDSHRSDRADARQSARWAARACRRYARLRAPSTIVASTDAMTDAASTAIFASS